MHQLKLSNSYTQKKEIFQPIDSNHIRIYACGPTVYNYAHIGNARMAVVFDTLQKLLKELYPKVSYVSNITDIDDKIIDAAQQNNCSIKSHSQKFLKIYNQDMAALNVAKPDIQPLATKYIASMIQFIKTLIEKGHAYESAGHVLFEVASYPNYGELSKRNTADQVAGSRVEIADYKKDAGDFVLWKPSTENQPGWQSPWGFGRPGWHTECCAMSKDTLGLPFDIHGGGLDLKFPHHDNEIAQTCCFLGPQKRATDFAKYWVHNGFVTVDEEKMSKSIGNVRWVNDLLKTYQGETLRLALLSSLYHQPLNWSESLIHQAQSNLNTLYRTLYENLSIPNEENAIIDKRFLEALCDDLNTPKALSYLLQLASEIKHIKNEQEKAYSLASLRKSASLLGILQQDAAAWLGYSDEGLDIKEIESLIKTRNEARQHKDFAQADAIRDKLKNLGIELEDSPKGTVWRKL